MCHLSLYHIRALQLSNLEQLVLPKSHHHSILCTGIWFGGIGTPDISLTLPFLPCLGNLNNLRMEWVEVRGGDRTGLVFP